MAKKPAMFNLGEGRLDHARIMMSASMLCSDTLEELEAIDEYAPDIRAYITSLTPPSYPFPVDRILADAGREVFSRNCSHCHGNHEGDATYPGRVIPIDVVQTDSTLVDFVHGPGAAYIDWYNRSYFGKLSKVAPVLATWHHLWELQGGKSGVDDVRVYDTTLTGYSNSGHLFADHLSGVERTAVIEYLKTL